MQWDEKRLQKEFDAHRCRDGADCPLLQMESVLTECIARVAIENEVEQTESRIEEALAIMRRSQR